MSGKKKVAKQVESVRKEKRLSVSENVESYLQKTPVWAFQHCDFRKRNILHSVVRSPSRNI